MIVDKDWTPDEAINATKEALREDPSLGGNVKTLPMFQWVALNQLDRRHEDYRSGDASALAAAIQLCAQHDLVMPAWVSMAFADGYYRVKGGLEKSWDGVFGRPHPKGRHIAAIAKKSKLQPSVYAAVKNYLKDNPNTPIDEALFEKVGGQFNIGKTLASEYYYEIENIVAPF